MPLPLGQGADSGLLRSSRTAPLRTAGAARPPAVRHPPQRGPSCERQRARSLHPCAAFGGARRGRDGQLDSLRRLILRQQHAGAGALREREGDREPELLCGCLGAAGTCCCGVDVVLAQRDPGKRLEVPHPPDGGQPLQRPASEPLDQTCGVCGRTAGLAP